MKKIINIDYLRPTQQKNIPKQTSTEDRLIKITNEGALEASLPHSSTTGSSSEMPCGLKT